MTGNSRTLTLGLAALSVSAIAFADDARALLEQMGRALSERNYRGTFVHQHGDATETLRIIHRGEPGGFTERVVSLDGSGREVIRRNGEVRAYFPDEHTVLVDSSQRGGLLFPGLAGLDSASGQVYSVREESHTRSSGREAHVVVVEPRDQFRYGYRVWIDKASAMPLRTQLRTADGRVVEQIVFTELTLPAHIPDSALQPAVTARDYRWLRRGAAPADDGSAPPAEATWDAAELPPGFRLISHSTQFVGGSQQPATHLVFSDGLASVSVFVEAPPPAARGPEPGYSTTTTTMTRLGSSSALSTEVDGHKVTAIGEVPPDTVRAITRSLRVGFAAGGMGFAPGGGSGGAPRH
jgi:sigma-E factor negative regulatory protein RseB